MIVRTKVKDVQKKQYDAIVIGSGMAGMACASSLAHTGKKVLVIEQHYCVGGMTHTFKRKGFVWDVGVHALGEMGKDKIPGKIMDWISDGKLTWNAYGDGEHKVYDTFHFPDGVDFELPSSVKVLKSQLIERYPHETCRPP